MAVNSETKALNPRVEHLNYLLVAHSWHLNLSNGSAQRFMTFDKLRNAVGNPDNEKGHVYTFITEKLDGLSDFIFYLF